MVSLLRLLLLSFQQEAMSTCDPSSQVVTYGLSAVQRGWPGKVKVSSISQKMHAKCQLISDTVGQLNMQNLTIAKHTIENL